MPSSSRDKSTYSSFTVFKPPRPSTGKSKTLASDKAKETFKKAQYVSSSGSDPEDGSNVGKQPKAAQIVPSNQKQHAVPRKVLVSLLHEHFKNKDTRITKEAMSSFSAYIDIFIDEAIQRAVQERRSEGQSSTTEFFLEVEDLEKLAPQLLLDF